MKAALDYNPITGALARMAARYRWLHAPVGILIVLLQRTPLVTMAADAESAIGSYGVEAIKGAFALAALGAYNSMAGATTFGVSPATPASAAAGGTFTISGTTGTAMNEAFTVTGAPGNPKSWSVTGTLPTGLTVTGGNPVNVSAPYKMTITGTPTVAGNWTVTVTAWSSANATSDHGSITCKFVISGSAANVAPSITAQPAGATVNVGGSATFTAAASGTPAPAFQWYHGATALSGQTGASLTLANVQTADAGSYTMTATNVAGSATTTAATLTVNAAAVAPSITTQPQSATVTAGTAVNFTVAAGGTSPFTYQWKKDGNNLAGATGANFALAGAQASDAGSYTVVVTNSAGSATSAAATLVVNAIPVAPSITSQPLSVAVKAGSPVSFTVAATGSAPLTYQWKKNGVVLAGSTGATYSIASAQRADAGSYTVVVSNLALSTTSNAATLVVRSPSNDFNGDGKADLVWQNSMTGESSLWYMNGTVFQSSVSLGTIPGGWSIAGSGDFNGDGSADLLLENSTTGEKVIWLMNGTAIGSTVSLGVTSPQWTVAGVGDFNGDGQPDIVWQNTTTGDRSVWLMNGTAFGSSVSLGNVPAEWSIAGVDDFNGDGQADLLWTNTRTGQLIVWLMNGTTFGSSISLGVVPVRYQVAGTGDYNGDGKPDIVWTDTLTGDRAFWLMNGTAYGSSSFLATLPVEWVLDRPVLRRVPVDFNGDANSDLIWQNTATGERVVWLMNGTSFLASAPLAVVSTDWSIAASADFNGDGQPDLVWQNATTGERVIWLMNGTSFLSSTSLGVIPPAWSIAGTGDFNGDGQTDIVWQNLTTGERIVWFMNGTSFASSSSFGVVPTAWSIAAIADFDGDGQPDILWQNTVTGECAIWLMSGTSYLGAVSLGVVPTAWSIAGTGDFNADGSPDVIWQNTATGERMIWLMNGTSYGSFVPLGVVPAAWSIKN
jgi:hypothetical protein